MSNFAYKNLYKDFVLTVAFTYIKKHNFLKISDEKNDKDFDDSKVNEIDVQNILTSDYLNMYNLEAISSVFKKVFFHHSINKDDDCPYLNPSIQNVLTSLRFASSPDASVNGFALFSGFKNINDLVVIKTVKPTNDKNINSIYED